MGMTTEEFISNFHSLHGTTIGERSKNLNLLLLKSSSSKLDFSSLQPTTPLEEKFKLETLIYFKRTPELIEVLKRENSIQIEKILKINWFLEEAFQNITGEQLTNLIFPHISFRTKVKLLNKFALKLKNQQQADDCFNAIQEKYGLYLATKLLPACSAKLIMKCVRMNKTKFLSRQLLNIIQTNPAVTEMILKELSSYVDFELKEYGLIFRYLARQDGALFLKLYDDLKLSFRIGWRITDKFVQSNKRDVIKNPDKFYKFLHNKQIAKSLNREFKDLYLSLFPPTLKQFKATFHNNIDILKKLPLKRRDVDLLLNNFERVYGGSLWDHSDLITIELLDLMPLNVRELKVRNDNIPPDMSEDNWYCYMSVDKSIPYLKKSISLCSDIKARVKLITLLVETCKINNDKATLAGMCNYMVSRHRNDHISVRLGFLNKLRNCYKIDDLEEQHWTPLNELIKIFTLNDEQFHHSTWYLQGFIHFRLKNNLPVKEQLVEWIKTSYDDFDIFKENPQYQKQCLLMLGEIIPESFKDDNNSIRFLKALINWNKKHPEDEISLYNYSSLLEVIKNILSTQSYMYTTEEIIKYVIKTKTNSEQKLEILSLFFAKKDNLSSDYDIINWLLHHEPTIINDNIQAVMKRLSKLQYTHRFAPFWSYVGYYTHLEIPQNIVNICLNVFTEKLEDGEREIIIQNSITALSYLMSSDDFKQFCVPYHPTSSKTTPKNEESQKTYKLQQNIAQSLRNLNPPSTALETLLIFSIGNYFKLIPSSLVSLTDQINEDQALPFINILTERTVPLRKHALHLTFRLLDKQQTHTLLNKFMQTEKNVSIRKLIFRCVFNYFLTNPDDYAWELVKLNINSLDINDNEAFRVLMQPEKIPGHYFGQYFVFAWDILNKLPDPEGKIESDKAFLLHSVNENLMALLPNEFCDQIIKDCLFQCKNDTLQWAVQIFTCRYVIYGNSQIEQEERLNLIFSLLQNFVGRTFDNKAQARCFITHFIETFSLNFLTTNQHTNIFSKFLELWMASFQPHHAFNDYLHLKFTSICLERLTVQETGQRLGQLCDSLSNIYGAYILQVFAEKITLLIKYFQHDLVEGYNFILAESLLGPSSSTNCLVLALLLLKGCEPNTLQVEEVYKSIIERLEKSSDPVIKLHLHTHFRETNCGA